MMADASRFDAAVTAALATLAAASLPEEAAKRTAPPDTMRSDRNFANRSALKTISFIILTDPTGYFPFAVSPLSMTASAPSYTAFVTSATSARVGRGFFAMDSNI